MNSSDGLGAFCMSPRGLLGIGNKASPKKLGAFLKLFYTAIHVFPEDHSVLEPNEQLATLKQAVQILEDNNWEQGDPLIGREIEALDLNLYEHQIDDTDISGTGFTGSEASKSTENTPDWMRTTSSISGQILTKTRTRTKKVRVRICP